jgi:hypothetical protein
MAASKHLFTAESEVEEMQLYFPFDGSFKFYELESDLSLVEEKFFRQDLLGDATFDALLGYIGDGNYPAGEHWEELRDRCRDIASRLTALYHLPESNVKYTNAGLLVTRSEGAVPASDNRTKDLKLSIVHKCQELMDMLVRFLNRNTAVFADWALSDNRKEYARLIIPDATTFSDIYPIGDNYWIFRKLRPFMVEVEDTYVTESLGAEYLEEIRSELENDNISADNLPVVKLLRKMLAYFTMAEAIPRLGIDISPRGIIMFSNERGSYDESFIPAEESRIKNLVDKALAQAKSQRFRLQSLLDDNASESKYTIYFNSDIYTDPEEGDFDYGNDPDDEERNGYYAG